MAHRYQSTKAWQVMGEPFELSTRFKVIDYLGSGAYGMVCAVHDYERNEVVAIKKCKKIFQSRTLAKRTLREMRLLRQFSHENIVKLKTILPPTDERYYSDLYLVFEIMDTDLAQIIRSAQPLKEQHTQYFIYQLLRALEYLHSKSIVHRDIKPRNILVNADCTLKVADFGLARMYRNDGPESATAITDYVTTRWYRAPEVIVGWTSYGAGIDMWAVGCIAAELIARAPLFPGENTMKQLGLIIRAMGSPNEAFIVRSQKSLFRQYMMSMMNRRPSELSQLLPAASPLAIDLIGRLLDYEPSRRPSATRCLSHGFIAGMSSSLSPPVCSPMLIAPEEFEFETRKLCIDDLRSEVAYEINYYNQPKRDVAPDAAAECPTEDDGMDAYPVGRKEEAEEEDALGEDVQVKAHAHHEAARLLQAPPMAQEAPANVVPTTYKAAVQEPWEARTPVPAPSVPAQQPDPALAEVRLFSSSSSDATLSRAGHARAQSGNAAGLVAPQHRASQSILEDSDHTCQLAEEVEALLLKNSGDNENPWDQVFWDVSDQPREEGSGDLEMRDLESGHPAGTKSAAYRDTSSKVPSTSSAAEQTSQVHRRAGSRSSAGSSSSAIQRAGSVTGGSAGASGREQAYSAEREVDEEAALVANYFTCFCEQEDVKEDAGRTGGGGAKRGGRGAATAEEEEECKLAYEAGEGDEEVVGRGWRPRPRRGGEGCGGETQRGGRRFWDQVASACTMM